MRREMSRRELLTAAGSAALLTALPSKAETVPNPFGHRGMGGAPTAFTARNGEGGRGARGAGQPFSFEFLEYCHNPGLGGAEMGNPPADADTIHKLRDKIQTND